MHPRNKHHSAAFEMAAGLCDHWQFYATPLVIGALAGRAQGAVAGTMDRTRRSDWRLNWCPSPLQRESLEAADPVDHCTKGQYRSDCPPW